MHLLTARFPAPAGVLDAHVRDFGEVLPHVFLGDMTRHVVALSSTPPETGADAHKRAEIPPFLEGAFARGGEDVRDPIALSSLENLPRAGDSGAEFRGMLVPSLSAALREIG